MGNFTNTYVDKILNYIFNGTSFTTVSGWNIGLLTANPGDAASEANEVAAGDYSRKSWTNWSLPTVSGNTRKLTNDGDVVWNAATSSWGTVSHWSVFDHTDTMIAYGEFTDGAGAPNHKAINNGYEARIIDGEFDLTISGTGFTDYLVQNIFAHIFGGSSYTSPSSTIYVGFSTTAPTDSGTNVTEPSSSNAYARKIFSDWTTCAGGVGISNDLDITWTEASNDGWVDCSHVLIYDATISGNLLMSHAVDITQTVSAGMAAKFTEGSLDITLD